MSKRRNGFSPWTLYDHLCNVVATRQDNECWVWPGTHNSTGYPMVGRDGKTTGAHRASYELRYGPIPEGLEADHTCETRSCWNPDHIEPTTRHENIMRGTGPEVTQRRHRNVSHCPQGHEYTPENTYTHRNRKGYDLRTCRACSRERTRTWRALRT